MDRVKCSICKNNEARYTCPRCCTRTCCVACSQKHKSTSGCSGERDKAAYVAMNKYGWGTMMNDYTYLEDVGRHATEWSREIGKGGFTNTEKRTKRDILSTQLDKLRINLELLPNGMQRRKVNQSYWDFKLGTAFLTIEFKFFPPHNPLASTRDKPVTFLTHKNDINKPLLGLLQHHIQGKKDKAEWLHDLVFPAPEDPEAFSPPHCVMKAPRIVSRTQTGYFRLEPLLPLRETLKEIEIVEFATIEVWEEFRGVVLDKEGIIQEEDEYYARKRRKIDVKAGKEAINGLLEGYGSSSEEEEEPLALLGNYTEEDESDILSA